MSIVKKSTAAKVPIIDPGLLGEKDYAVRMVIIRKYIFAARLNWNKRERGAHDNREYLKHFYIDVNFTL